MPGSNYQMAPKYSDWVYGSSEPEKEETINGLPMDLATRLFNRIQQKRNKLPVRNKVQIDASIQTIQWGKKKVINKELYSLLLKSIYNQMKDVAKFGYWSERKALKRFIENTLMKMYIVS